MKHFVTITALAVSLVCANAQAATPAKEKPEALAAAVKVSMAEAKAIALKARPGKITDSELEQEAGGSGLRYSFDIKVGKVTYEVGVDAKTGAVLENAPEGKNPD